MRRRGFLGMCGVALAFPIKALGSFVPSKVKPGQTESLTWYSWWEERAVILHLPETYPGSGEGVQKIVLIEYRAISLPFDPTRWDIRSSDGFSCVVRAKTPAEIRQRTTKCRLEVEREAATKIMREYMEGRRRYLFLEGI